MKLFKLEKRKTNPKALYAACMVGLSIAIPALIIAPKVIEAREASKPLENTACHYAGSDLPGEWHILEDKGDSYVIVHLRNNTGKRTVPKSEVTVDERFIPEEYRWFRFLFH